ncbi:MAG: molybdenum cofactor guanylyltransferase [Deltaproteobacteria bacterium]|nr:molybdenum cofactor guanylyltransferase [Deltaproteobacteria bacterium]
MRDDVTALIVAGGRATRLGGVDKRELVVDGQTIFERQCAVLAPRVAEIVVSTARDVAGFRTVRDPVADGGPLAGIAAGLAAATTPWLLVVAGDMPYLSAAVIDLVLAQAGDAATDAVGVKLGEVPEPLVCVLRVAACRPVVEARLAACQLRAAELLTGGELRVYWLDEAAVRRVDPELRAFLSINEAADLR